VHARPEADDFRAGTTEVCINYIYMLYEWWLWIPATSHRFCDERVRFHYSRLSPVRARAVHT